VAAGAAVSALLMVLAACGSSSRPSSTTAPNNASAATGSSSGSSSDTVGSAGSGSGGSAANATADPCSLLTQSEATAALGEAADPAKKTDGPVPGCIWGATNGAHVADAVQVQIQDVAVFDGTVKSESDPQVTSTFSFETVNGLGDQAFFQIPKTTGGPVAILLGFKKGGVAVYVSVNNQDLSTDQVKAAENTLAQEVAARM
jgi:hypothetical protein